MQAFWTATVVVAICLADGPAGAQGLADAARRAEESRKGSPAPSVSFDARDVDPAIAARELLGYQISEGTWKQFVSADHRVMAVLEKDAALYRRLEVLRVSSARVIERFLLREPALLKVIRASGTNARDYAYTSVAIGVALAIIAGDPGPAALEQMPEATKANIAFVRAHETEIRELLLRGQRLQQKMSQPKGS